MANIPTKLYNSRRPAWDTIGENVEGASSAEQAMKLAHLAGWNVRLQPLVAHETGETGMVTELEVPDRFATVRTNPLNNRSEVLGVVGKKYQEFQNEEMCDLLNGIIDMGGAQCETAGYHGNGQKVFMVMKLPDSIVIGGSDRHDLHLVAGTSHDGSGALTIAATPIRLVCMNQMNMALRNAVSSWSLRHSSSIHGRIEEARTSLRLTYKYAEEFEGQMNSLLEEEFTNAEFWNLVQHVIPIKEDAKENGWTDRQRANQGTLNNLFRGAHTQDFGRGTKYAAYNALVEYADWYMPVKGKDSDGTKRATRIMEGGVVQQFKNKSLALLT